MARTLKDAVRQLPDLHADAPYWKYRYCDWHGNKRSSAKIRRLRNRQRRARARHLMVNEQEPWRERNDLGWIYW